VQIWAEIQEGVHSETQYDQKDLMSSGKDYVVVADICDPIFNKISASTTSNFFNPSFLSIVRNHGGTLQLSPGRKVADGENNGRGFISMKEDVLPSLRRLLSLKDLPRVRIPFFVGRRVRRVER